MVQWWITDLLVPRGSEVEGSKATQLVCMTTLLATWHSCRFQQTRLCIVGSAVSWKTSENVTSFSLLLNNPSNLDYFSPVMWSYWSFSFQHFHVLKYLLFTHAHKILTVLVFIYDNNYLIFATLISDFVWFIFYKYKHEIRHV